MFNKTRLTVARQRRSLTKTELARRIGVDPRAVSGFEAGQYEPSQETLMRIIKELQYPREFFEADDIDIPDTAGVSFRALTKMTARQRDAAVAAGALAYQLIDWVEEEFDLPEVDLPDLREDEPQVAALSLRQYWALGERPVKNMIHLLEAKGVRVFSLAEDNAEVDAYSVWRGKRPCVFINTGKSSERRRYDAAHELGHLVMHRHALRSGSEAEREANSFASAFLMPEASLKAIGRIRTIEQIISIKKKWNVSVAAMTTRLHEIGIISTWNYKALYVELSKRGYRTREPQGSQNETSLLWQKVFAEKRRDGFGLAQLSQKLHVPQDELLNLLFGLVTLGLPSNEASGDRVVQRPHLRLVK